MNARLNVVRFSNEDVIATSEFCLLYGKDHFLADGTYQVNDDGSLSANGQPYVYAKGVGLVEAFSGLTMPVSDPNSLQPGYYYSTEGGTVWVYCPNQEHLH